MKKTAKFLSLIIVFCMLIACVPSKIEANADDDAIYILAGSDFQAGSNEASSSNVKSIISAVKASGVTSIDGFLFGGDYNTEYDDKAEEIEALKSTVMGEFTTLNSKNMIFVLLIYIAKIILSGIIRCYFQKNIYKITYPS